MARPRKITNEQILDAARTTFFEKGPEATTAEIATQAGVSEGTIFRRFATKQELFLAALGQDKLPEIFSKIEDFKNPIDLDEVLVQLASETVDFFLKVIPKTSLLMSSALAKGCKPVRSSKAPPALVIKHLTHLFDAWQRSGRIRASDPEVLARMFAGAMMHYVFATLSGLNDIFPMPRRTYFRGVIETLLKGALPRDA